MGLQVAKVVCPLNGSCQRYHAFKTVYCHNRQVLRMLGIKCLACKCLNYGFCQRSYAIPLIKIPRQYHILGGIVVLCRKI